VLRKVSQSGRRQFMRNLVEPINAAQQTPRVGLTEIELAGDIAHAR
jgi:hypothetical protein